MKLLFEWDADKAKRNLLKHKISFQEAKTIFQDEMIVTYLDDFHSDHEERFLSIGMSTNSRILLVVHTETKAVGETFLIRIISGRKATVKERRIYEKGY
ncbi:MAG: BrnT family toxin [Pyrinomonadaceae bacterium]